MDKAAEAKKDVKHWKAQVDGLEESLKATKAALATSHAEPVVPEACPSPTTARWPSTPRTAWLRPRTAPGLLYSMAGEAAKAGYQALVDAIPAEEAKKLGEDAVDAMYGAVDKGKAKTAEAYGNAWGYAVANEYVAPSPRPGRGEGIRRVQQGRLDHVRRLLRQDPDAVREAREKIRGRRFD